MNKEILYTNQAPAPVGPYSQAVKAGNTVYISGQIALHPQTGAMMNDSVESEAHRVMQNLQELLIVAGMTFDNVVKTTIFLLDMADFAAVNHIYGSYFTVADYPARETVAVVGLPKSARVEISLIAVS